MQYNQKTFVDTPVRLLIDKAIEYLHTDIFNINRYFSKRYRISIEPADAQEKIIEKLPTKLQEFLKEPMEIMPASLIPIEAHKERSVIVKDNRIRRRTKALKEFQRFYKV